MLSTYLYDLEVQRILDNWRSADAHGDREMRDKLTKHFSNLLDYMKERNLVIAGDDAGRLLFKRYSTHYPETGYIQTRDHAPTYPPHTRQFWPAPSPHTHA